MELTEKLSALDAAFVDGRVEEVVNAHTDKNAVAHIQNLITLRGKSAVANLHNLRAGLGDDATVEVLAQRVIDGDSSTVSLYSVEGAPVDGRRRKSLFLLARRFNDKGKVVEEELLPIGSTADAQAYFPDERLPAKQVQPRLSFVAATRKRRAGKTGAARMPRRLKDTDLHRLGMVGPKVLSNLREAGIQTFRQLAEASDDALAAVRDASGRKLTNFDYTYWRDAGRMASNGEFDKIPPPPSPRATKVSKRDSKVDFSTLRDDDLRYLPKVGPQLLRAFNEANIHTFADLAHASDDALEALRKPAGRPFVNFDMTYFRTAARKVLEGAKSVPAPPSPQKASGSGRGRAGRKPRPVNPNDIHELPGVGAQLVAALHKRDINTFADIASASTEVLREARAETRGKYKNIDIAYLKRQARHAEAGQFDKIELPVKIDKPEAVSTKSDPEARFRQRLRASDGSSIGILPSLGPGIRNELATRGITTMKQLANADPAVLRDVVAGSGRRFARFDVNFWIDAAKKFVAGDLDSIPHRAPVAEKKPSSGRKRGPRGSGRAPGRARTPRDNNDLQALPSVGSTVAHELKAAGLDTFDKIAKASEEKLRAVRANAGPKFKSFDVAYWQKVAKMASEGKYDYPAPPRAEGKSEKKGERKARARKPADPSKLRKLANVGSGLADALRSNGLNTWHDIIDAENWVIHKALAEAGNRSKNMDPEELKRSAKDAIAGKFAERKPRGRKPKLPEGYDDFTALPGLGKGVQSKLHEAGVKTYSDLAKANIGLLEEIRDQVRGRVARSNVRDWKELGRLAAKGEWHKVDPSKYAEGAEESQPKASKPKAEAGKDDFRRIKGIGPQAVQIFHSRGVRTFIGIAALSDDALAAILEEGGPRARALSPSAVRDEAAELAAEANEAAMSNGDNGDNGKSDKSKSKGNKSKKSKSSGKSKDKD